MTLHKKLIDYFILLVCCTVVNFITTYFIVEIDLKMNTIFLKKTSTAYELCAEAVVVPSELRFVNYKNQKENIVWFVILLFCMAFCNFVVIGINK